MNYGLAIIHATSGNLAAANVGGISRLGTVTIDYDVSYSQSDDNLDDGMASATALIHLCLCGGAFLHSPMDGLHDTFCIHNF